MRHRWFHLTKNWAKHDLGLSIMYPGTVHHHRYLEWYWCVIQSCTYWIWRVISRWPFRGPLYPLKPGFSRGPPGLSGGPGQYQYQPIQYQLAIATLSMYYYNYYKDLLIVVKAQWRHHLKTGALQTGSCGLSTMYGRVYMCSGDI